MQCKVDSTDFVSSVILELVHLTTIPSRIHAQCLPVERFLPSPGQCSTAAPPAHRLHVCMSSEDSEVFEYAAADVLDLVETVCDMVGEELGMNEDEAERLTRLIRAEKYFEAKRRPDSFATVALKTAGGGRVVLFCFYPQKFCA